MQRQDREAWMRRGFTMVTAGVVTRRLPRLDDLYRRAGQLEWSWLKLSVTNLHFYAAANWSGDDFICLVAVDGWQQFLALQEWMVYRTHPRVVVLHLYATRLVHYGWPGNECSQLKLGHTGQFRLRVPSPSSHDGVILSVKTWILSFILENECMVLIYSWVDLQNIQNCIVSHNISIN